MTKSAPRKVAARKARSASKSTANARSRNRRTPQKVAAKLRNDIAAETVRESHQLIGPIRPRVSSSRHTSRPGRTEMSLRRESSMKAQRTRSKLCWRAGRDRSVPLGRVPRRLIVASSILLSATSIPVSTLRRTSPARGT